MMLLFIFSASPAPVHAQPPNLSGDLSKLAKEKVEELVVKLLFDAAAKQLAERWIFTTVTIIDTRTVGGVDAGKIRDDFRVRLGISLAQLAAKKGPRWKGIVLEGPTEEYYEALALVAVSFSEELNALLKTGGKGLPASSIALAVFGVIQPNGFIEWTLLGAYKKGEKVNTVFRCVTGSTRELASHVAGMAQSL